MNMKELSKHPITMMVLTVAITASGTYFGFMRNSEVRDNTHTLNIQHLTQSHEKHIQKDREQDTEIASIKSLLNSYSSLPPRVAQLEKFTETIKADLSEVKLNQSLQKNDADHMMHDLDEIKELLKSQIK